MKETRVAHTIFEGPVVGGRKQSDNEATFGDLLSPLSRMPETVLNISSPSCSEGGFTTPFPGLAHAE